MTKTTITKFICVASLLLFSVGCGDTYDSYIVDCVDDSVLDELCDGGTCVLANHIDTNSVTSIDTIWIKDGEASNVQDGFGAVVNGAGELVLDKYTCKTRGVTRVNIHISYK